MSHRIYFRILGYLVTIVMHVSNMTVMMRSFHGEVMKNEYVRHFSEMQFFFFTCWTFFLQIVYALFALTTDLLELKNYKIKDYEVPKFWADSRDSIFAILVWPPTIFVFTIFWALYHYDRSLLFPEDIDQVITYTSNHIMHTFIFPAVLLEVMFRSRRPPKNHRWNLLGVVMLAVVYFRVLFMVHAIRGVWVYPIFGVLRGTIIFYLFFLLIFAYLPVVYYSQWTLNSLLLQTAYACYALVCDLFIPKNEKLPSPIGDLREILFAGLVWPCSMVVFTIFWGLYSYDRALIFLKFLDAVIPPISNHVIHTMIVPVVLWEVMTRPRKEPENHARNVSQLTMHLCVYVSVLYFTYVERGIWLYPIFRKLFGTIYFYLALAAMGLFFFLFYYLQWPITNMIHGSKKKAEKKKAKLEKKNK